MHIEWSEEKFLKGSVGHQMKLSFWNKRQMTALLLMQLPNYRYADKKNEISIKYQLLTRKMKYQLDVLIDLGFRV